MMSSFPLMNEVLPFRYSVENISEFSKTRFWEHDKNRVHVTVQHSVSAWMQKNGKKKKKKTLQEWSRSCAVFQTMI